MSGQAADYMMNENTETVRRIDFDLLHKLVSLRINAFKVYAQNIGVAAASPEQELDEAICRDLILPNISLLLDFVAAVKIGQIEDAR